MKPNKQVILVVIYSIAITLGMSAGFDCRKASTSIEHAICDNPELSQADSELSYAYKKASEIRNIRKEQRNWVKHRNRTCGSNTSCLLRLTNERTNELLSITGDTYQVRSNLSTNEIQILDHDEINNITKVMIKGNGAYCTLTIRNNHIKHTNCIQMINSKNIHILCTKKKEICKTTDEIYESIEKEFSNARLAMQELQEEHMDIPKDDLCQNSNLDNLILKDGSYAWFHPSSEAIIDIKRVGKNIYSVKGNAFLDLNGRTSSIEFTVPMKCGVLTYYDESGSFIIRASNSYSFDVEDNRVGEVASFDSDHFVLNQKRPKNEKKIDEPIKQTTQYKRVYFDELSTFPMDYQNKYIKIKCGLGGIQTEYDDSLNGFIIHAYCELRHEIDGGDYMQDISKVLLFIPNTSDENGKSLVKKIRNNTDKLYMFKGVFKKTDNLLLNDYALIIEDVDFLKKTPAEHLRDLFK